MRNESLSLHPVHERFQTLSIEEAESVAGGETLLYWVSYGIGVIVHTLAHSSPTQSSGQKLANAALS